MIEYLLSVQGAVARVFAAASAVLGVAAMSGCTKVPESVKLYAADLPARADGQYALIDDDAVKKSLILKDALLKCKIDEEQSSGETSPACQCAKSSSTDWTSDCRAWLGDHTPKPTPPTPASAPPTTATTVSKS